MAAAWEREREQPENLEYRFSSKPSLDELREMISQFARERDWEQFHTPRNMLFDLIGEVGEVSELLQWRPETQPGLPGWSDGERVALADELGDVLMSTIRLAELCRVDLPAAAAAKVQLNCNKYPVQEYRGTFRKYNSSTGDAAAPTDCKASASNASAEDPPEGNKDDVQTPVTAGVPCRKRASTCDRHHCSKSTCLHDSEKATSKRARPSEAII